MTEAFLFVGFAGVAVLAGMLFDGWQARRDARRRNPRPRR